MSMITVTQLEQAAPPPYAKQEIIDAITTRADQVFTKHGLTTIEKVWGFLSVAIEETGGLHTVFENLNYTAEQAHRVWPSMFPTIESAQPFVVNAETFANKVYGHRMGNINPGDGWKYRGQGLIQITGHDNFLMLQKLTGLPLLDHPELVTDKANMLECAVALFVRYPGILEYCDEGHWHAVWALVGSGRATGRIINLPAHERALAHVQRAIPALGPPAPAVAGAITPAAASAAAGPVALAPAATPDGAAGGGSSSDSSILGALGSLITRLENAISRIPRPA